MSKPRVFLDISVGTEPFGRLVIELFTDKTPKTCEKLVAISVARPEAYWTQFPRLVHKREASTDI